MQGPWQQQRLQETSGRALTGLHHARKVEGTSLHEPVLGKHQNLARTQYEVGGEEREVSMFNAETTCIFTSLHVRSFSSCALHKQEPAPVRRRPHMGWAAGCYCYCHNTWVERCQPVPGPS